MVKLSIVILCWNDKKVIDNCLRSIFEGTRLTTFEVIVSDNGSTDASVGFIREAYPEVKIIENGENLGFAKGNNVGIRASQGELVLILNPDTIVHGNALDKFVEFADKHPEAGGFGCRVLNPDGSYEPSARPFPTVWRQWIAALYLRPLGYLSKMFLSDIYVGWRGDTQREVDWQAGCCVMFRAELLKRLGGFDEQFFYHCEEVDLCRRVWQAGYPIIFTPEVEITHLAGQSVARFPIRFELEKNRSHYRYFHKHYGKRAVYGYRRAILAWIRVRQLGYGLIGLFRPTEEITSRLNMYRIVARWNKGLDPARFIECGEEPELEHVVVGQRP